MVIGGYSNEDGIFYNVGNLNPPLEIIDLIDTTSKPVIVADTNGSRKGAIGGILQNKPVICGGYDSDVEPIANFSIIGMSNTVILRFPRSLWQPKNRVNRNSRYTSHSIDKKCLKKCQKNFY